MPIPTPLALATAIAFCLAWLPALAQESESSPRSIQVIGDGELKVVPDHVVYAMAIETSSKEVDKAREEGDERMKELVALARSLGIAEGDIRVDNLNLQPDYLDEDPRYSNNVEDKRRKPIGFTTTRSVVVTLRQIDRGEEFIARALKLGVNYVSPGDYRYSRLEERRDSVRRMAVRVAKERALALAGELGARIGQPLYMTEVGLWEESWWRPQANSRRYRQMMQEMASSGESGGYYGPAPSSVLPGEILLSSRVNVVFELE